MKPCYNSKVTLIATQLLCIGVQHDIQAWLDYLLGNIYNINTIDLFYISTTYFSDSNSKVEEGGALSHFPTKLHEIDFNGGNQQPWDSSL